MRGWPLKQFDRLARCLLESNKFMTAREQGTHVLLVEDNPAVAYLTAGCLRQCPAPVTVDHVESGEAALAYLRRDDPYADSLWPSLIVLDLGLPGMSGLDVLRYLKSYPPWSTIPVVIFTCSSDESDRRIAKENGVCAYLLKPSNPDEWVQAASELWTRCSGP